VSLRRRLEMKQEQIEQVKIELEKKRQALMQASQERKVIEKLKEKYDEMQAQELSYREQAMIDEVAAFGVRTINRDPSHD
jgi:flagellar FliJ protein